jgi:signal transduction histidine kinase
MINRRDFLESALQVGAGIGTGATAVNAGHAPSVSQGMEQQEPVGQRFDEEQRLADVGFLAAGVAHEIGDPLTTIAVCSEALEQHLVGLLKGNFEGESSRGTITKYLKTIQEETFRGKEIIQRLLEFSRGGERRREPTEVAELVLSVLDMVKHLDGHRNKHIIFEPAVRVVAAVNPREIRSVVLNLVVNALDSMDDGGRLSITMVHKDGVVELVFADTGCGMSPNILKNLFLPFVTNSRSGKGTGLGLFIGHRIISQHGGQIWARSPGPGQGSTFTIRLPV